MIFLVHQRKASQGMEIAGKVHIHMPIAGCPCCRSEGADNILQNLQGNGALCTSAEGTVTYTSWSRYVLSLEGQVVQSDVAMKIKEEEVETLSAQLQVPSTLTPLFTPNTSPPKTL